MYRGAVWLAVLRVEPPPFIHHGGIRGKRTKTPKNAIGKERSNQTERTRCLAPHLLVDLAIWSTSSVEVLVQSMADALHTESNSLKIRFFRSMFSNTASTICGGIGIRRLNSDVANYCATLAVYVILTCLSRFRQRGGEGGQGDGRAYITVSTCEASFPGTTADTGT